MKTKLLLRFGVLLTVLLITTSEGLFFEHHKKALFDFLYSLKGKKEAKKKPDVNDIQHYHVHYHPVPIYEPPTKAPKQHELETIHNEHLATLGWFKHEYKYTPEPKITIRSNLFKSWKVPISWDHKTSEIDFLETAGHSLNDDIFVQVPFNQKIVIEPSGYDEKLKRRLL